jgi:AraC-like DNA-binding protein
LGFSIAFPAVLLYNKARILSIHKIRHEVRKTDMNILLHPNIKFHYSGLFQSVGEWIHPDRTEATTEIIYVRKGTVYLNENGSELQINKGQLVVLEPNLRHFGTRHSTDVSFYWLHFDIRYGDLPFKKRFFESFEYSALFKELLHYQNIPSSPEYLTNSILIHILSELCRLSGEHGDTKSATAEKLYEWIRINADATLTVSKIAKQFGFSTDHISRICKKNFGIGASELINRFLCEKAKSLLFNTDNYIKEIAAELKFPSDKAFISYFKYHFNCSPTEMRNRYGSIHMNVK